MTCTEAEEHLLESLEGSLPGPLLVSLDAHVRGCQACAGFAGRIRLVDAQLAAAFTPLAVPPGLTARIRSGIRRERVRALDELLPDIIHLAGGVLTTLLSAALLPVEASITIAVGVASTAITYACMAVVRWSLESAAQPDW